MKKKSFIFYNELHSFQVELLKILDEPPVNNSSKGSSNILDLLNPLDDILFQNDSPSQTTSNGKRTFEFQRIIIFYSPFLNDRQFEFNSTNDRIR